MFLIDVLGNEDLEAFGHILLERVPYNLIEISCVYRLRNGMDDEIQSGNGSGVHRPEERQNFPVADITSTHNT